MGKARPKPKPKPFTTLLESDKVNWNKTISMPPTAIKV